MYNKEQKEKFIVSYTTKQVIAQRCIRTFTISESYETEWGADICTRTADEIQPMVDDLVFGRSNNYHLNLMILRDYAKWCLDSGISGATDGMLKADIQGLKKIRKQLFLNPSHLQEYLNMAFDPETDQTNDNVYRCFCWMAYAGMYVSDILVAKTSDVDLSRMTITANGREYRLCTESMAAFFQCKTLMQFVYEHPGYRSKQYRDRVDGDELLRGIRGKSKYNTFVCVLGARSAKLEQEGRSDIELSYSRLWMSGVFYRMYQRELKGLPADFEQIAADFMEGKDYKLGPTNTREHKMRQVSKDFESNYVRWKNAYNL